MKLFCRKYGEGPPLIILHGLLGSSDNWVTIAKKLGSLFTVYLPDLRNHGNSPHDHIHDYESMNNDLLELVSDLGLVKFFLAGHSMGGKTAMLFSSLRPEMIGGLLVADISPFTDSKRKTEAMFENTLILRSVLDCDLSVKSRDEVEKALSEKISSQRIRELIMKNLRRRDDTSFEWKINALPLLENLEKIVGDVPFKNPENCQVSGFPVIFLKGENSGHLKISDYQNISRVFPAAEFRTIPGAGHWIQADNPKAVTEAIASLNS